MVTNNGYYNILIRLDEGLRLQFLEKKLQIFSGLYEVCLKSKGTVHDAQTNFIAEKKALLSMMSQCLMVSKTKHQHSLTTTFLFARFFCQGTSFVTVLWKFDKIKNFWLFFSSSVRRMSVEQQINRKLLVRLGKTLTEALKLLQKVYGDDTLSRTRLFEWHKRFKEKREEVEDDHRSGRPSTTRTDENVERVRQKVQSNRRLTVRMIADELGMNSGREGMDIGGYKSVNR